jgi:hypothetical protein
MTIKVKDLIEWLETLDLNDMVYVDEDGLALCSELEPEAYIEIGGEADEEFEDE